MVVVPLLKSLGFNLELLDMELVNKDPEKFYIWAHATTSTIAIPVNLYAAACIRRKEKTKMSCLIIISCLANILTMSLATFQFFPWFTPNSWPVCLTHSSLMMTLMTWNRLVPIAIVVFRYVMVCHAITCHNNGGESGVWRAVMAALVGVTLASAGMPFLVTENSRTFQECIGSEERFM